MGFPKNNVISITVIFEKKLTFMFRVKFPELSKKVKNNTRVRKRKAKIKNFSAATSIMKRIALLSKKIGFL